MAWVVVAQDPDGTKHRITCKDAGEVSDHFNAQRKMGRKVSIEEASGKEVAASQFGIKGNIA